MAEAYGNVVNRWQAYINAWVSSQTDTTATIHVDVYGHSIAWGYNVNGASGRASIDGTSSGSSSFKMYAATGETRNSFACSYERTVTKTSGSRSISVSGTVTLSGGYHNGTSTASTSVTIERRKWYAPYPPKNPWALRVSDQSQRIGWTPDYTDSNGAYPWTGVRIERKTDGGSWSQIASVSWDVTTWTDNTTSADHAYAYRVRSYNPDATSSYSVADPPLVTTPKAPGSVGVTRTGGTNVSISASGTSGVATQHQVQTSLNGADWVDRGEVTKWPLSVNVGGGTVRARVRSIAEMEDTNKLFSGWTVSGTVQTVVAPNAPSVRVGKSVQPKSESTTVSWVKSHPDGSAQTAAQVELVLPDGKVSTANVSGAASSYTQAGPRSATGVWKVRVRTKGLSADWGAWSGYVSFSVYDPPTVSFSAPASGTVVKQLPMTILWGVSDPTGVSEQTLTIRNSRGSVAYQRSPGPTARELTLSESTWIPVNGEKYTVELAVTGGSSLSSTAQTSFSTAWAGPASPYIEATVDADQLQVTLAASAPASGSLAATKRVTFERIYADGTSATLATMDIAEATMVDRIPPLGVPVRYRATSHAEDGSTNSSTVTVTVPSDGREAYNFGAAAETLLAPLFDASVSESVSATGETFRFALGSGTAPLPTFYPDGDVDVTGSHSYLLTDAAEYRAWRSAARASSGAVCWYRDAWGRSAFGHVEVGLSYDAKAYKQWKLSVAFTECVWEEPVNG